MGTDILKRGTFQIIRIPLWKEGLVDFCEPLVERFRIAFELILSQANPVGVLYVLLDAYLMEETHKLNFKCLINCANATTARTLF